MNELQRQMYLSALGVETYMPRWYLPFAPASIACELPQIEQQVDIDSVKTSVQIDITSHRQPAINNLPINTAQDAALVNHLLTNLLDEKKPEKVSPAPISAASILAQLESRADVVEPFSLSVWRPFDGMMVIDSRNTKLALPTELLFKNMIEHIFSKKALQLKEEVLRWPMIENSFAKRTINDAKTELQTWLSVQHEIRPINYLWLMGNNAAHYFIESDITLKELQFNSSSLVGVELKALILPSLVELLQSPLLKRNLLTAASAYHV